MAVYHLISSKSVVGKVYRDFDIRNSQWEEDAVEWVGELLEGLGAYQDQRIIQTTLSVTSYKVDLPAHISKLEEVWKKNLTTNRHQRVLYDKDNFQADKVGIDVWPSYVVQPGQLLFTFEEGTVTLVYKTICLDSNGYPLIPNDVDFRRSATWYIAWMLMLRGWEHPNSKVDVDYAEQRYLKYFSQARGRIKMPMRDHAMSIVREWQGGEGYNHESLFEIASVEETQGEGSTVQYQPTVGYGNETYGSLVETEEETTTEEEDVSTCDTNTGPTEANLSSIEVVGIQFRFVDPPVRVTQYNSGGLEVIIKYSTNKALVNSDVILATWPAGATAEVSTGEIVVTVPSFGAGPYASTVTVFGTVLNITIEAS